MNSNFNTEQCEFLKALTAETFIEHLKLVINPPNDSHYLHIDAFFAFSFFSKVVYSLHKYYFYKIKKNFF